MKLLVGLGNPGKIYQNTRHNIGFVVIDEFQKANNFSAWKKSARFKAEFCQGENFTEKIILAKPKTFMNKSGQAVKTLAAFYKIKPENIWVIHDDLDLPFGAIRLIRKSSAAGHRGVKSIIANLKSTNFVRFKIGVANEERQKIPAANFVLQKFAGTEKDKLEEIKKFTLQAINTALISGITEAQNEYN